MVLGLQGFLGSYTGTGGNVAAAGPGAGWMNRVALARGVGGSYGGAGLVGQPVAAGANSTVGATYGDAMWPTDAGERAEDNTTEP